VETRFSALVQTCPGAHSASYKMGVKQPGRGINHPPPSSAEVKERVELYLYSSSGSSWPVLGRTCKTNVQVSAHLCSPVTCHLSPKTVLFISSLPPQAARFMKLKVECSSHGSKAIRPLLTHKRGSVGKQNLRDVQFLI
jgi:hypothetical protein